MVTRDTWRFRSSGQVRRGDELKPKKPSGCCLCLTPPASSTNCEVRCAAPLPTSRQPGRERVGAGSRGTSSRACAAHWKDPGSGFSTREASARGKQRKAPSPFGGPACAGSRGGGGSGAGRGAATPVLPPPRRSRCLRPLVAVAAARLAWPRSAATRRRCSPGWPVSHGSTLRGGSAHARDGGADSRRHPGGRGRGGAGGRGGGGGGAERGRPSSVPQPRLGQRQRGGAEPRAQVGKAARRCGGAAGPGLEPPTPSPGRTGVGGPQLCGHSGLSTRQPGAALACPTESDPVFGGCLCPSPEPVTPPRLQGWRRGS